MRCIVVSQINLLISTQLSHIVKRSNVCTTAQQTMVKIIVVSYGRPRIWPILSLKPWKRWIKILQLVVEILGCAKHQNNRLYAGVVPTNGASVKLTLQLNYLVYLMTHRKAPLITVHCFANWNVRNSWWHGQWLELAVRSDRSSALLSTRMRTKRLSDFTPVFSHTPG